MKIDKKTRWTILNHIKISDNEQALYVVNDKSEQEFRYIIGSYEKPTLKIRAKSPKNFYNGLMNMSNLSDDKKREIMLWMYEIASEYVFPLEHYYEFAKEVEDIASSQKK